MVTSPSPAIRFAPRTHVPQRRVLVVEDDRDMWRLIETVARSMDRKLRVDCVDRANAALSLMETDCYDLILADFILEDSPNGFWLRARSALHQPQATFALMSVLPLNPPDDADCPFLHKPFTPWELRDFLGRLLP